jgi:hypothetical protein
MSLCLHDEPKKRFEDAMDQQHKTVVLVGDETVFRTAVENLLVPEELWQILKIPENQNPGKTIQTIEEYKPCAVILLQNEHTDYNGLLWELIQNSIEIKVIKVNMGDNSIHVFNNQRLWINEPADLLTAIKAV